MFEDADIKIFTSERSCEEKNVFTQKLDKPTVIAANDLGKKIAAEFISAVSQPLEDEEADSSMLLQRQFLLSFTVSVVLEEVCSDSVAGIAQKQFLDSLKKKSSVIYKNSSDTGAFTFYYLAYRRGGDIERRIGQTFAMLCSHDGDPIYQELGEALYCWFSSVIKKMAVELALVHPQNSGI